MPPAAFSFFSAELFQSRYFFWLFLADYWFRTGSPTYLIRLLSHFDENINEMVNRFYPTSSFIDYKADVESPLPMIYQSGYLTIKDWNMDTDSYLLDFPNDEVRSGFRRWSKQQSEGRVDYVVEPQNYIYIFEFKRDGSAEEARSR